MNTLSIVLKGTAACAVFVSTFAIACPDGHYRVGFICLPNSGRAVNEVLELPNEINKGANEVLPTPPEIIDGAGRILFPDGFEVTTTDTPDAKLQDRMRQMPRILSW